MRARRAQGLQIKKKLKTGAKRAGPDNDYGMVDEDAPEPLEVLEHMKDDFIKNLSRMTAEDRFQLQKSTTLQVDRSIWMTERRKRLSASNHGDVCHMRPYTSCKRLVHSNTIRIRMYFGHGEWKENGGVSERPLAMHGVQG